jgi:hypothetical protein
MFSIFLFILCIQFTRHYSSRVFIGGFSFIIVDLWEAADSFDNIYVLYSNMMRQEMTKQIIAIKLCTENINDKMKSYQFRPSLQ